jgi:hypothetical protein
MRHVALVKERRANRKGRRISLVIAVVVVAVVAIIVCARVNIFVTTRDAGNLP